MVKRMKRDHDFSVTAFRVVREATDPKPQPSNGNGKNFDAKALGRLGGLKGGVVRAERLSPERRSEIAKRAAVARWGVRA